MWADKIPRYIPIHDHLINGTLKSCAHPKFPVNGFAYNPKYTTEMSKKNEVLLPSCS